MEEYDGFPFSSFQVGDPVIVDLDFLLDQTGGASLGIDCQLEHRFRKKEIKCCEQNNDGNDDEQSVT
jgi:hypothetical protein